eukprot:92667-Pleurochrysis_carterae.AAC.1
MTRPAPSSSPLFPTGGPWQRGDRSQEALSASAGRMQCLQSRLKENASPLERVRVRLLRRMRSCWVEPMGRSESAPLGDTPISASVLPVAASGWWGTYGLTPSDEDIDVSEHWNDCWAASAIASSRFGVKSARTRGDGMPTRGDDSPASSEGYLADWVVWGR